MKAGASEFLLKPFDEADLLQAVDAALKQSSIQKLKNDELTTLQQRYSLLSPKEREPHS